jgi:hypothetical protein
VKRGPSPFKVKDFVPEKISRRAQHRKKFFGFGGASG